MARDPKEDKANKPELSPRAREIKKQIDEGRYEVDIAALAGALVEAGALDEPGHSGPASDTESDGGSDGDEDLNLAQNDQKPRSD